MYVSAHISNIPYVHMRNTACAFLFCRSHYKMYICYIYFMSVLYLCQDKFYIL
jgi:hypothetical protein